MVGLSAENRLKLRAKRPRSRKKKRGRRSSTHAPSSVVPIVTVSSRCLFALRLRLLELVVQATARVVLIEAGGFHSVIPALEPAPGGGDEGRMRLRDVADAE